MVTKMYLIAAYYIEKHLLIIRKINNGIFIMRFYHIIRNKASLSQKFSTFYKELLYFFSHIDKTYKLL